MKPARIARLLLLAVAAATLLIACLLFVETRAFLRAGTIARATIVANEARTDEDGSVLYYPHFVFSTNDGRSISVVSDTGTDPPGFRVGQQVNVIYDPSNPAAARLDNFIQLWFMPLLFGLIGLIFFCIELGIRLYERRRRNKLATTA